MALRRSLIASLFALVLLPNGAAQARTPTRPNILLILADDLGYSDIGAFGGEISTPNLDAIASRGLRLTGLHAAPTCSPTRAMLLSGLDNHEAGLGAMAESLAPNQRGRAGYEGYLRPDVPSLAERLAPAGYRTLFAGKWHLGLTPAQDPSARGFQRSFAMLQGSHNHFGQGLSADPDKVGGFTYRENGRTLTSLPKGFYSSDAFADRLIAQLKETRGNGDRPFLAYLAFTAPHWPLQAPAETIAKYRGRYDAGYDVLRQERLRRQVALGLIDGSVAAHAPDLSKRWDSLTPAERARASRRMEVYAAMVDRLDWNVGRVVQALQASGDLDNTVILFLSDNGAEGSALEDRSVPRVVARYDAADNRLTNIGAATSYESIGPGWAEAASAPAWRYKAYETEGGTRVVSMLAGPGVPRGIARAYTHVADVVPTVLALADMRVDTGAQAIRGRSWLPLLRSVSARVHPGDEAIGSELFGGRSLRRGDWKLLDTGDGRWRLFDVARDPGETMDLAAREPARAAALRAAYDRYARMVGVIPPSERPAILKR